jgi:hypothetical protein
LGELVTCYTELIQRLRDRVGQLGVRYLDFDVLAGFADGLSGKIFGPAQVKRLGIEKMFDALRAAGLRIRIEVDPEQTAKMKTRIAQNFNPRQAQQVRPHNDANMSNDAIDRVLNYLVNKRGGLIRLNAAVRRARSNCARRAAIAQWKQRRECGTAGTGVIHIVSPASLTPEDHHRSSAPNACSTSANAA